MAVLSFCLCPYDRAEKAEVAVLPVCHVLSLTCLGLILSYRLVSAGPVFQRAVCALVTVMLGGQQGTALTLAGGGRRAEGGCLWPQPS